MQPEDLADAMKFVAALHPRTSVTELALVPDIPEGRTAPRGDGPAGVARAGAPMPVAPPVTIATCSCTRPISRGRAPREPAWRRGNPLE